MGLGPCRAYGSVDELLASGEVDAVWILGPNDTRSTCAPSVGPRRMESLSPGCCLRETAGA